MKPDIWKKMKKFRIILVTIFFSLVFAAEWPQANLKIHPYYAEIGTEITFDASDSRNSEGKSDGLKYRFKLNQDSEWTGFSSQAVIKETFWDTGIFTAQAEVWDLKSDDRQIVSRTYRVGEPWNRRAWIFMEKDRIKQGEPASFEIRVQFPPFEKEEAIRTRWDFDGDGEWDTDFLKQKIVTHIYTNFKSGTFSPRAEVIFPNEEHRIIESFDQTLTVSPFFLNPPILDVSPGISGDEDTSFLFEVSNSVLPKNGWIEWSFDGAPYETGKKYVYKKFQTPGTHTVRVKICYDRKDPICESATTKIELEEKPVRFQVEIKTQNLSRNSDQSTSYFKAFLGDELRFSAEIRNPDSDRKFYYRWDFDGDGDWDTGFLEKNFQKKTYYETGYKTIKVQAQSEDGKTAEQTKKIYLSPFSDLDLDLNIRLEPPYPKIGDTVSFIPQISNLWGQRYQVRFDIGADDVWESVLGGVGRFQWTFYEAGKKKIKLQVVDQNQKVWNAIKTFEVFHPGHVPESRPQLLEADEKKNPTSGLQTSIIATKTPKAKAVVSRKYGHTRTTFEFDASESRGSNLRYQWEFFEIQNQNPELLDRHTFSAFTKTTKVFSEPGEKNIRLTVKDDKGQTESIEFSVEVQSYESVREVWQAEAKEWKKQQEQKKIAACENRTHIFTFFSVKGEPVSTLYRCGNGTRIKLEY